MDVADQSIYAGNVSDKRQEALDAVGWDSLCFAQILDDAEEILNDKIRGVYTFQPSSATVHN